MNIICDVAGCYQTLMKVVKQMPKEEFVFVGDLNDRGLGVKEVYDFVLENNCRVVKSNHGHMMVDAYEFGNYYNKGIWFMNGGLSTLQSFAPTRRTELYRLWNEVSDYYLGPYSHLVQKNNEFDYQKRVVDVIREIIPKEIIEFEKTRPLFIEEDGVIITHAPINPAMSFEMACDIGDSCRHPRCESSVIWNRGGVRRHPDHFQVHGHMARRNIMKFEDKEGLFAIGLDTSRVKITGMNWPSMEIYDSVIME